MQVHLVDGTYELFRYFYAVPPTPDAAGRETGAVRGVLASLLGLVESGATHVGVATDTVIESFRNELYPGYKTGDGIDPALWSQFPLLEEGLSQLGFRLWPMVEFEADDALAAAARLAAADPRVSQVVVCSPDKDLAQCVEGTRVVQLDRRRNLTRDEAGIREKFGVAPASIPDYLALVGDSADGYPGLPGWGAKAASTTLAAHPRLEDIPLNPREWPRSLRGVERLSATLRDRWEEALLYRRLATLRRDVPVFADVEELRWRGPAPEFAGFCESLGAAFLAERARAICLR